MVNVAPEIVHTEPTPAAKLTGFPLAPPVATTVNVSFLLEVAGGGTLNIMAWLNGTAATVSVAGAAAE